VFQREISGSLAENLLFPFCDISGYGAVRAGKVSLVFLNQPVINPLGRMPLFPFGLFIFCQPCVDIRLERIQLGEFNLSHGSTPDIIPIFLVKVHPYRLSVTPGFL